MSIVLQVNVDLKPLRGALLMMSKEAGDFAIRDALTRTRDRVYTVAKREIAKTANIAISDIAKAMHKGPVSTEGTYIMVKDRWYPGGYRQFRASQSGFGASFTPWKGSRQTIKSGFIAEMKSGHTSIFKRVGKSRLPIADVGWGPNPAREFVRPDSQTPVVVQMEAARVFQSRFKYQYQRAVSKAKAAYGL